MVRTPFVPARNSRHRTAALALYRALLKSASKIVLPHTIGKVSAASKPLEALLRRQVKRNSNDVSPRLVFAAMTAGYKFLGLLEKARDPLSVEYADIVRKVSVQKFPSPSKAPAPDKRIPLIRKASGPGEAPEYTSDIFPRPKKALKASRRVPMLATTSHGQPFLTVQKPQHHDMSRMIGTKERLYVYLVGKVLSIKNELIPDSQQEDEWDRIVARQMRKENLTCDEHDNNIESSFEWSPRLSRLWYEWKIESIWIDWIARSEALQRIIDAERQLADEEAGKDATKSLKARSYPGWERSEARVKVREHHYLQPPLCQVELAKEQGYDIFSSQAWAKVVQSRKRALRNFAEEESPFF